MQNVYKKDSTTLNLLQDVDVVYGANENGSYIKFSNGTLICFGNKRFTYSVNQSWLEDFYFYLKTDFIFPIPFTSILYVGASSNSNYIFNCSPYSYDTKGIYVLYLTGTQSYENLNSLFNYIAVGRWK